MNGPPCSPTRRLLLGAAGAGRLAAAALVLLLLVAAAPAAAQFPPPGGSSTPFAITGTTPADGASTGDRTPTIIVTGNKEMTLTTLAIDGDEVDLNNERIDCEWNGVEAECKVTLQRALCPGAHTARADAETATLFGVPETDSVTWAFTVTGDGCNPGDARPTPRDPAPPKVIGAAPTGATPEARPTIEVRFRDDVGVTHAGATMRLDGAAVPAELRAGILRYTPSEDLAPGEHTVSVRLENVAGNATRHAWTFTMDPQAAPHSADAPCAADAPVANPVHDPAAHGGYPDGDAPPRVVAWGPQGTVAAVRPNVSAGFLDGAGVLWNGVRLTVDGDPVPRESLAYTAQRVVHRPAQDLAPGEHTARLTVTNVEGRTTTHAWRFTVDPACGEAPPRVHAFNFTGLAIRGARVTLAGNATLGATAAALNGTPPDVPALDATVVAVEQLRLNASAVVERVRLTLQVDDAALREQGAGGVAALVADGDAWRRVDLRYPVAWFSGDHLRGYTATVDAPVPNPLTVAVVADATAPAIGDPAPGDGAVTNHVSAISVPATDNIPGALMVQFTINGKPVDAAPLGTGFRAALSDLAEPHYDVRVLVRDAVGNAAQREWSFTYDDAPPVITLDANATPPRATVADAVSGVDAATLRVTLDGEALDATVGDDGAITLDALPDLAPGDHALEVTVQDHAGNGARARATVTVPADGTPAAGAAWLLAALLLAGLLGRRGPGRRC